MKTLAALAVTVVLAACHAQASEHPQSAIPWLSKVLATPDPSLQTAADPDPSAQITVTPLGDHSLDPIGILPAEQTGIPRDFWANSSTLRARQLISNTRFDGPPALRSLFRDILLSQLDPPKGGSTSNAAFLARLDKLLAIGALDYAGSLIQEAGADSPELFSRWFDISLLTNNADEACTMLSHSPMLSPSRKVQVFCLARSGDWDAAAVSLTLAESLGQLDAVDSQLMAFFLDPALIEEEDPPAARMPMTALEFLIRESVGLPRASPPLPLAFLHTDLADYVPVRFQMAAAEQLVREGLLDPARLFAAYRQEAPASSGGIWDRAAAVQNLDAARGAEFGTAFARMDRQLTQAGLRMAAVDQLAPKLASMTHATHPDLNPDLAALYLLLKATPNLARPWITDRSSAELRIAALILGDSRPIPRNITASQHAILAPFLETDPARLLDDRQKMLIRQKKTGEVVFAAIDILAHADRPDPDDTSRALAALRQVGLDSRAREIAVQLLLLDLRLDDAE